MFPKIIHPSWHPVFAPAAQEMEKIRMAIGGIDVCPEPVNIFKAFSRPLGQARVLVMGLAPYNISFGHEKYATGLAFAVPRRFPLMRPSLSVMIKCLSHNYGVDARVYSDLESWHEQGVILVNAAMSVPHRGKAKSHLPLWEGFWRTVGPEIARHVKVAAYFGRDAQVLSMYGSFARKLRFVHPAATARHLGPGGDYDPETMPRHSNMIHQRPFSTINSVLMDYGIDHINWFEGQSEPIGTHGENVQSPEPDIFNSF